jgi:hypothetical protein
MLFKNIITVNTDKNKRAIDTKWSVIDLKQVGYIFTTRL